MRGPTILFLVILAALGGWFFFRDYPIATGPGSTGIMSAGHYPEASTTPGMQGVALRSGISHPHRSRLGEHPFRIPNYLPRDPRFLRVASLNIEMFERDKAEDPVAMQTLATILAQFDVTAIQGVAATQSYTIGNLVDAINRTGRRYDYVVGPRVGRDEFTSRRFAFVFDLSRAEVDKNELYTVEDPDDLLRWEPLVAWFRTRGVRQQDAFTFTLVNVETDPHERERENAVLSSVFRAVRNDQRQEDDVLLAGCFFMSSDELSQQTGAVPNIDWAIFDGVSTRTQGTAQDDNLMSCRNFTDEFTGRTGVFDFLRQLNLSLDQADRISSHLPVWAEYTAVEGGILNTWDQDNAAPSAIQRGPAR